MVGREEDFGGDGDCDCVLVAAGPLVLQGFVSDSSIGS